MTHNMCWQLPEGSNPKSLPVVTPGRWNGWAEGRGEKRKRHFHVLFCILLYCGNVLLLASVSFKEI